MAQIIKDEIHEASVASGIPRRTLQWRMEHVSESGKRRTLQEAVAMGEAKKIPQQSPLA